MEPIILENLTTSVTAYDQESAAQWPNEVINHQYAAGFGADGYDPTAPGGVTLCRQLLEG